jgi:hypothetical protein
MLTHKCVHRGDHGNVVGYMVVLNFILGFSNWDLKTFQEFKEMKGITHKRQKKKQEIYYPEEHGSFFALMQLCP